MHSEKAVATSCLSPVMFVSTNQRGAALKCRLWGACVYTHCAYALCRADSLPARGKLFTWLNAPLLFLNNGALRMLDAMEWSLLFSLSQLHPTPCCWRARRIQASDPQDQEQPGQEWPQPVQEQPRHGQQQQEQFQLPPLHQQHLHTAHLQPLQPQLEQSLFQAHALQASDGFAHAQAFQQHLIPAMQLQTAPAGGFMLPAQQQQPASFPQAPLLQPHFQLHVPFPPMHTQYPVAAHQQVQQQVPLPQGQLPFQPLHQVAPQPPLHINPMFTPGWG